MSSLSHEGCVCGFDEALLFPSRIKVRRIMRVGRLIRRMAIVFIFLFCCNRIREHTTRNSLNRDRIVISQYFNYFTKV